MLMVSQTLAKSQHANTSGHPEKGAGPKTSGQFLQGQHPGELRCNTVDSGMVKTAPRQAPIMEVPLPARHVGNKGVNKIGQEKPERSVSHPVKVSTRINTSRFFWMFGKTWQARQAMSKIEATYCQVCHQLMTWYKMPCQITLWPAGFFKSSPILGLGIPGTLTSEGFQDRIQPE